MGTYVFKQKLETELEYDCVVNERKLSQRGLNDWKRAGIGILSCSRMESCCAPKMRSLEQRQWSWMGRDWNQSQISGFVDLELLDPDHSDSLVSRSAILYLGGKNTQLNSKASLPQNSYRSSISWSSTLSGSQTFKPYPFTEVISGKLYLGCEDNATNEDQLLALGITHVLSLSNRIYRIQGIEHEHFVMSDIGRTELDIVLAQVCPFMKRSQLADNKLFVHCKLGQNRAPTLVIAFLIKNRGMTLYEAHKMLKEKRPLVQIHRNYAKMLLTLERTILRETSLPDDWMEHDGYLDGVPYFKSEEMTIEEQQLFKSKQKLNISVSQ